MHSSKHTYDGYTLTVEFKDEQQFAITASDTYTGETFINEEVELTTIKKDTVLAALTRKNEKNIACTLCTQLRQVQPCGRVAQETDHRL